MSSNEATPEVLWAQRSSSTDAEKNFIYLTIMATDVDRKTLELDLKPTSLTFKGHSDTKKTTYHVELEFYEEIDVENSQTNISARDISMKLRKKELKDEYWPRLLKTTQRMHFLKTDFDKWVDEDEQEDAPDQDFGSMGDMGMPGMGGMGGMGGGMGGLDFSKLGAMGGMGGMPDMGDMPDMGGADSDDDDMPGLEDEGASGKGKEAAGTGAEDDGEDDGAAAEATKETTTTGEAGEKTEGGSSSKIEELS